MSFLLLWEELVKFLGLSCSK